MPSLLRQRFAILATLGLVVAAPMLWSEDVPPEKIFAEAGFDQWVKQGPVTALPWKVLIQPNGLSLHQRMSVHIEAQMLRRRLVRRPVDQRMLVLVQIISPDGGSFRNYEAF